MDLSWVSLKLDSEMSPSLLPLLESVGHSQGLRAMRQCREGVGLSIERWYKGGMVMVWRWWYIDPRIETWLWMEMGWNGCGNGVKT